MVFLALKTSDLVPKVVGTNFGTRLKVLIMVFVALKNFQKIMNKSFDLMPKIIIN
jgi:hypothetical protein